MRSLKNSIIPIVVFLLLIGTTKIQAQDYKTGIGIRMGYSPGITVKHFILEKLALEGILATRPSFILRKNPGFVITTLAEYHFKFKNVDNFSLLLGGGLHYGYWVYQGATAAPHGFSLFGLDAIFGIEYTFPDLPLTFQIDVKPNVDFVEFITWFPQEMFSVSARYSF